MQLKRKMQITQQNRSVKWINEFVTGKSYRYCRRISQNMKKIQYLYTSCIIYPQNARILAHVIVYFIDCIFIFYIFKIKWFSTCTDICHSGLLQNYTHFYLYWRKKSFAKHQQMCWGLKSHVSHTILWLILYFKVLVPEKMEYFIYNNKIESQSLNEWSCDTLKLCLSCMINILVK